MTDPINCPKCGAELIANAPGGLCPKCLMQAGFASEERAFFPDRGAATTQALAGFDAPAPEQLKPLFPQLEILELLGRGGMGAVYKARQPELDRLVAVKILPPEVSADPAFAGRFTREARALARLNHQNIVAVYDFGQASGLYYFVMEYVDGTNLRQLIHSGGLEPAAALALVPQICEALQFAHDEGIVHRDIKPENILVDKRGRVKIADFGLAKLLSQTSAEPHLTATHQVMGTPRYMAPEQMRGSERVDHRADIYSLGVVFYEMLTGELPVGHFPPPSACAHVDARLDQIVYRAMAREPDQRYQQVSQVKTDVEGIRQPPAMPQPPVRESRAEAKPAAARDEAPRFSRQAILGACWAPLFFVAAILAIVPVRVHSSSIPYPAQPAYQTMTADGRVVEVFRAEPMPPRIQDTGPRWWQWILIATILPLGIAAPFGTTILGIVAIGNVRRSQGRLVGLPLAVADALFYPLIVLDLMIVGVAAAICVAGMSILGHLLGPGGMPNMGISLGLVILLSVPLCVAADILIAYATWRKAASRPSVGGQ